VFLVTLVTSLLVACSPGGEGGGGASAGSGGTPIVRLGFFPNLTHATALVGLEGGIFARELGDAKLDATPFNAGPQAVEALFSEAVDATYIGPNPAINAHVRSKGEALRIISGATSGGALLVVRPNINSAADLRGKKVATPQLGNTQDVALRSWLARQGLQTTTTGGGDVQILNQENAQTLDLFRAGEIDGAWVPEPWATRLELDGGGKVLVDEKDLWPRGQFVTTHLVVRTRFLQEHPDLVDRLLRGQVAANKLVNADPARARQLANARIKTVTGKPIDAKVLAAAWERLTFTNDPIASSLRTSAANAEALGLLDKGANLDGIYDLGPLNRVLSTTGEAEVGA
jgi:NitT/TauT family transport system substrate-binding protein